MKQVREQSKKTSFRKLEKTKKSITVSIRRCKQKKKKNRKEIPARKSITSNHIKKKKTYNSCLSYQKKKKSTEAQRKRKRTR